MNPTPEEKLFDHLSNVDTDLLDEAMELDSAKKLQKHRKTSPYTQKPIFRMAVAAAACLAIIAGILPMFNREAPPTGDAQLDTPPNMIEPTWGTRPTDPTNPLDSTKPSIPIESLAPPWENVGSNLSIESADMLNYYSALYLLSQQYQAKLTRSGSSSGYGLTLLDEPDFPISGIYTGPPADDIPIWDGSTDITLPPNISIPEPSIGDEPYCTMPPPPSEWGTGYTEPPDNTEGPPVNPPVDPTIPPDAEIYYYHFDPNATFHLSEVIFFRIQLSGNGFLAQTLGAGIVDVVITDLGISEPMITLRNGDKYLSCLLNGGSDTFFEFSTHKYIEGFSIVKNFRQKNYAFVVTLDGKMQVDHFECQNFDYGNTPDGVVPVVGETYITEADLTFTIDQLENYFRSLEIPQ